MERYPYDNLAVIVSHLTENEQVIRRDTLDVNLNRGENLPSSSLLQRVSLSIPTIHIRKKQIYRLKVRHMMSTDPLPGIVDVGVLIKEEQDD